MRAVQLPAVLVASIHLFVGHAMRPEHLDGLDVQEEVTVGEKRKSVEETSKTEEAFTKKPNKGDNTQAPFPEKIGLHECRAGTSRIDVEEICIAIAKKIGNWGSAGDWPHLPKGCYEKDRATVYFNRAGYGQYEHNAWKQKSSDVTNDRRAPVCQATIAIEKDDFAGSVRVRKVEAIVFKGPSNKDCFAGSEQIKNEEACKTIGGYNRLPSYTRSASWSHIPSGCITFKNNDNKQEVAYNHNKKGKNNRMARPMCFTWSGETQMESQSVEHQPEQPDGVWSVRPLLATFVPVIVASVAIA